MSPKKSGLLAKKSTSSKDLKDIKSWKRLGPKDSLKEKGEHEIDESKGQKPQDPRIGSSNTGPRRNL